jgi:hemerythrin-like domain-containing protein
MTALIRSCFLADHRRIETALEQLLRALATEANVSQSWPELESDLLRHLEAEELRLFPALLRASERDTRVLVQEHRHIRTRLADLGKGFALGIKRPKSLRDFTHEIRAHAKTEDRLLYRWADLQLDDVGRHAAMAALAKSSTA